MVHLSEDAKAGAWPDAGGTLDQSALFVSAHRFVRSEAASWEAEQYKRARREA